MPRPPRCRRVAALPKSAGFRPQGARRPGAGIALGLDETEALRLADLEGLHHREAAARMRVSRPTFSRIVEVARKKVARALLEGRPLKLVSGGERGPRSARIYCPGCRSAWRPAALLRKAGSCPRCRKQRGRAGNRA
jgi:predicted DNA-binding protein (UPF0251 family)